MSTETIKAFSSDGLAIAATEILGAMRKARRYGRDRGFAGGDWTRHAMQSDYVRLACEMYRIVVHIERTKLLDGTSHSWWFWIEKEKRT